MLVVLHPRTVERAVAPQATRGLRSGAGSDETSYVVPLAARADRGGLQVIALPRTGRVTAL